MKNNNLLGLISLLKVIGIFLICASMSFIEAQAPLETETARPLKKGEVEIQAAFEYQISKEGKEIAVPFAFEYGITDRLTILVEPIFYTSIRPKIGTRATSVGDLEITLAYLVAKETKRRPAFSIAGEFKLPTTKNPLIGTGKTDFAAFLYASKKIGKFEVNGNVGYTFVGKPRNFTVSNTLNLAFSTEYKVNKRFSVLGEVLINGIGQKETVAVPGVPIPISPEAAGGELVGTIGFRYKIKPNFELSLGVSHDNAGATLFRPGLTYKFNLPKIFK
jgi:hypothetical protein